MSTAPIRSAPVTLGAAAPTPAEPASPVTTSSARIDALSHVIGFGRTLVLAEIGLNPGITTTSLAARCQLSASAISLHAKALRGCGLVRAARRGPWVHHTLTELGLDLLLGGTADQP